MKAPREKRNSTKKAAAGGSAPKPTGTHAAWARGSCGADGAGAVASRGWVVRKQNATLDCSSHPRPQALRSL